MTTGSREDSVRRFWERYRAAAVSPGIRPSQLRWYQLRAEQFVRAFPGHRLADLSADDVADYLGHAGHGAGIAQNRSAHQRDLAAGLGEVILPDALATKFPAAPREWRWQFVFRFLNLSIRASCRFGDSAEFHRPSKQCR